MLASGGSLFLTCAVAAAIMATVQGQYLKGD